MFDGQIFDPRIFDTEDRIIPRLNGDVYIKEDLEGDVYIGEARGTQV